MSHAVTRAWNLDCSVQSRLLGVSEGYIICSRIRTFWQSLLEMADSSPTHACNIHELFP